MKYGLIDDGSKAPYTMIINGQVFQWEARLEEILARGRLYPMSKEDWTKEFSYSFKKSRLLIPEELL